jgi:hypothetical protein
MQLQPESNTGVSLYLQKHNHKTCLSKSSKYYGKSWTYNDDVIVFTLSSPLCHITCVRVKFLYVDSIESPLFIITS